MSRVVGSFLKICEKQPHNLGKREAPSKQLEEVVMKYGELNLGQIEAVVNKIGGMDNVERLLRGELVVKPRQMIIEGLRTIPNEDKEPAVLVHFGYVMSSSEVLHELKERNLRPATHDELVAISKKHPKLPRHEVIIALGSWEQRPNFKVFSCLEGRTGKIVQHGDRNWTGVFWFAAFRK